MAKEKYIADVITNLTIMHNMPSENMLIKFHSDLKNEKRVKNIKNVNIKNNLIPNTMDLFEWNDNIKFLSDNIAYFTKGGLQYHFHLNDNSYTCNVEEVNTGITLYKFIDEVSPNIDDRIIIDLNSFTRTTYLFDKSSSNWRVKSIKNIVSGGQVSVIYPNHEDQFIGFRYTNKKKTNNIIHNINLHKREYSTKVPYILPPKISKSSGAELFFKSGQFKSGGFLKFNLGNITFKSNKILTFDLETIIDENQEMSVVSASVFDGKINKTFILTDYIEVGGNTSDMIDDILAYIISPKYVGWKCYSHNFSRFDGIFLFNHLANLESKGYEVDVIYRDGKLMKVTVKLFKVNSKGKRIKILGTTFFDSLLLMPDSLNKLASCFGFEMKKEFNVKGISLDRIKSDSKYKSRLLEYNAWDAELLYKILLLFRKNIFDLFGVDIQSCATISSVAFKVFLKNYYYPMIRMEQVLNKWWSAIQITTYELYSQIIPSYRGGAVEVFRNHGFKLWHYDVNSLYPWIMKTNFFPIGKYSSFKGDINLKDKLAIVYAEVEAPKDLFTPFLITRIKGNNVAPLGKWSDWYTSVEIEHARSMGYKIKVIRGYKWNRKAKLFTDYVTDIYNNRLKYPKTDSRNSICKYLLNSLYGRFGMSPNMVEYKIINKDENVDRLPVSMVSLGNYTLQGFSIIRNSSESKLRYIDISTPIAIFVTAYARVFMSKLVNKYQNNIYYMDTDSLILDKELPGDMVGVELGKFKLEAFIDEAIFLGPKVYALRIGDNFIIKVKGLKSLNLTGSLKKQHDLNSFEMFKNLLIQGTSHKLDNIKWFRDLSRANMKIASSMYTLMATENKREFVYKNGVLSYTLPYVI